MLKNEIGDSNINHTDVNESFKLFLNTFYLFLNHIFQCNIQLTLHLTASGLQKEAKHLVGTKDSLHYEPDNQLFSKLKYITIDIAVCYGM